MTTFISTTNISLYTLPLAWLTCIGQHIHAIKLYEHLTGAPSRDSSTPTSSPSYSAATSEYREDEDFRFDKAQPRTFMFLISRNPHPALTPSVKAKLQRIEAASWNGYENLGLFCSAVVAANLGLVASGLRTGSGGTSTTSMQRYVWWMNVNSIGYVVCRLMFNLFYEYGCSGIARGGWFYASIGCCLSMIVRAANVLRRV